MDYTVIIAAIIGSNILHYLVVRFFDRKKVKAETDHMSADEKKLLAEASKINAETDNTISEGWRRIADKLMIERDQALERIKDLELMAEQESRLYELKEEKIRTEYGNMLNELRRQLHAERERYDNKITEIVKEILDTKIKQNAR